MTELCQCDKDGYCERYNREMGGRMRELCAGVNVDLGTAAAFREQWAREALTNPTEGIKTGPCVVNPPRYLLLRTDQAPGDAVAMTAAIYSLHKAYPGQYITAVESYWPDVFAHNPHVSEHTLPTGDYKERIGVSVVQMHYPAIHTSNTRGIHFMEAWCEFLGSALGVPVPLLTNRPHLYFSDPQPPQSDYWIVCSGGKRDFTTKLWGQARYQEVVDRLYHGVKFIQVGGAQPAVPWNESCAGSQTDDHPRLYNVVDVVGQTSLRQLFDLVRRARGVLCGVSLLMHIAAALEKPAVVIAGGREPVQWNSYPKQRYLHTVGSTPCHDAYGRGGGACWRYRTVPLNDGTLLDRDTCEYPVDGTPQCMRLISPAYVAETIRQVIGE